MIIIWALRCSKDFEAALLAAFGDTIKTPSLRRILYNSDAESGSVWRLWRCTPRLSWDFAYIQMPPRSLAKAADCCKMAVIGRARPY